MKALLLAAGYGKRLMPLTKNLPKCLVEINGVTMLDFWINKMKKIGIKDIIINTHYFSELVEKHLIKYNDSDIIITTVFEKKLCGTAGTLINNYPLYKSSDIIMVHVDNYMEESLNNFIYYNNNKNDQTLMSMLTFNTEKPQFSGIVKTKNNILIDYFEKLPSSHGNIANAAVYILSKEILLLIKENFSNSFDFAKEIIPSFLNKIYCYHTNKYFIDIGDINSLNKTKAFIKNNAIIS